MRVMLVTGYHPSQRMGGAEYQTLLISQGLADRGHDVTFVAASTAEESETHQDGLRICALPGWRYVGVAEHRERLRDLLHRLEPEICYVRVFDEAGLAVPLCNEEGVRSVSVSCHVRETGPLLRTSEPAEAFRHLRSFLSIGHSAIHVCNTQDLQERVRRWYPRHPVRTIYNASPAPPQEELHTRATGQVIWVNNMKRWKRPEVYIDLAEQLPQYSFVMVGQLPPGRYGRALQRRLQQAGPSLHYLGPRPVDEVNGHIAQSDLLLYTSLPVEGFGNSFLQAWFRQVPTVSLGFELDGIPERERIGRCPPDTRRLVSDVRELMQDHGERLAMGERARAYALRYHTIDRMLDDYESMFQEVCAC